MTVEREVEVGVEVGVLEGVLLLHAFSRLLLAAISALCLAAVNEFFSNRRRESKVVMHFP